MTDTQTEALPANDELAVAAQKHMLRIAVKEYHVTKAEEARGAARVAAQADFAAARNRGLKTADVTLPDGTNLGTLSLLGGGKTVSVREEELILCARSDELEDYVLHSALTDPRALKVLKDFLPELVGRRIEPGVRAAFQTELEERGGTVTDHNTGERETVATITRHDATGRCQWKPGKLSQQQIRDAIDAGLITEDGKIIPPKPEPEPIEPEPEVRAAVVPSARREVPRSGRGGRTPTGEQAEVVDAFKAGGNLVVDAGAGTGKTSTLVMCGEADPGRRGNYITFNASIAAEARRKFPANVACSTAHALAKAAVGYQYEHRLNGARVPAREQAVILGVNSPVKVGDRMLAPTQLARLAVTTVEKYCKSADDELAARHVPGVNGLEDNALAAALAAEVLPLARRAWADIRSFDGRLKFDHGHYLKMWQLSHPTISADFLMYDEAQDAAPVVLDVVLRQTDSQLVAVGDRCQAINGWTGAINAMDKFPASTRLMLRRSFRFGPAVAREANKWLAILGADLRLQGSGQISSMVRTLENPAAILCRTNAEAMSQAMKTMDAGRRVAIVGGGKAIRALAEAAGELKSGRGTGHPELFAFRTWAEVQDHAENDAAGADLRVLVNLIDEHGPDQIIAAADALADEKGADTVVSTAHKSKGREWDSVRIASDFREPRRDPQRPDRPVVPDDLAMLAYVAFTRAKQGLDRGGLAWVDNYLPGVAV
jgi:hypothetical protein